MNIKSKNDFFSELINKQLKTLDNSKKLSYNDLKRISKFLETSIFDEEQCSIWKGYITNELNREKGTYINFYFNKKKIALHRLLYMNFVEDINPCDYIKYTCINKGKCCNINHMRKYHYNKDIEHEVPEPETVLISYDDKDLILEF